MLLSLNYHGLEMIILSESRHAMRTVATGLQSGVQLMDHFGGSRGKKIFIFIPSQGLYLFELLLKLTKPLHILFNLFPSNGTRVLYQHNSSYAWFSVKLVFMLGKFTFPAAWQFQAQINKKLANLRTVKTFKGHL